MEIKIDEGKDAGVGYQNAPVPQKESDEDNLHPPVSTRGRGRGKGREISRVVRDSMQVRTRARAMKTLPSHKTQSHKIKEKRRKEIEGQFQDVVSPEQATPQKDSLTALRELIASVGIDITQVSDYDADADDEGYFQSPPKAKKEKPRAKDTAIPSTSKSTLAKTSAVPKASTAPNVPVVAAPNVPVVAAPNVPVVAAPKTSTVPKASPAPSVPVVAAPNISTASTESSQHQSSRQRNKFNKPNGFSCYINFRAREDKIKGHFNDLVKKYNDDWQALSQDGKEYWKDLSKSQRQTKADDKRTNRNESSQPRLL